MKTKNGIEFEVTTGNVLADLDVPDADLLQMKNRLAVEIQRIAKERKFTQARVAELTKLSQPNVSALMNLRVQGFSLDRLVETAQRLGAHVEIQMGQMNQDTSERLREATNASKMADQLHQQLGEQLKGVKDIEEFARNLRRQMEPVHKQLEQFQKLSRKYGI